MGRVFIDLVRVELPSSGPVEYSMKPGNHQIILNREGYEPIRFDVTLGAGERSSYRPEWKLVMFDSETSPATAAKPAGEISRAVQPPQTATPRRASKVKSHPQRPKRGYEEVTVSMKQSGRSADGPNPDVLPLGTY